MVANLENAAISKLRNWKEEQMAVIKQREEALAKQLRAAVPESFSVWLEEAGDEIIADLFEYGVASRKYRRDEDEGQVYGYTDLDEFERRFEKLRTAWDGVVKICISWDADYRFEVTFKPV